MRRCTLRDLGKWLRKRQPAGAQNLLLMKYANLPLSLASLK
jgi:hypothetical protein